MQEHARVVAVFRTALESADLASLIEILDPNATAIPDGGGVVQAAIEPIVGAETIARHFLGLYRLLPDLLIQLTTVNGLAGLVVQGCAGHALAVAFVAITRGVIERIWVIRNLGKLTGWT